MRELQPGAPWTDAVSRAAAVLYDAGATAVWLFGSRARGRTADRLTDFDLGVEGLPDGKGAIDRATREFVGKVDIVRMESANPNIRWAVMRNRIFIPRVTFTGAASPSRPPLPDSLAGTRTSAVARFIRDIAPRSVIDFGCGFGLLLAELTVDERVERLTGVDFDLNTLARARRRMVRVAGPGWEKKVELREGLITHRDPAFLGHDAAAAIEVIEHLEMSQLEAFVGVLFDFVRPTRVVLTTPNAEYNTLWFTHRPRGRRHPDHRFEWSRTEFAAWVKRIALAHEYDVRIAPVGAVHPLRGPPTQLAVFDRRN